MPKNVSTEYSVIPHKAATIRNLNYYYHTIIEENIQKIEQKTGFF